MAYNEQFMQFCIEQAKLAANEGEVPVGAVVVYKNEIIGIGRNHRELYKNALCHAEIEAINAACKTLDSWRLTDCDLYVTLEPCPMCAGAAINARIKNVYFGAYDKKAGSFGSLVDLSEQNYNHKPKIFGGIMQNKCQQLLSDFFSKLR